MIDFKQMESMNGIMNPIKDANSTKKHRSRISQTVAGACAALMLVSMLSSCDELTEDHVNGTETEDTADSLIDAPMVDSEDFWEVEEFSSKPFDPQNCGSIWPLLSTHDYSKVFRESASAINEKSPYEVLKEDYEDRAKACKVSTEEFYNCSYDPHISVALYQLVGEGDNSSNFSFDFVYNGAGWEHRLVSAGNSFALVSTDPDGNIFLTGFVNGRLENDLGFIDDSSIKLAKDLANNYSYTDILNSVRRNCIGLMYESMKALDKRFVAGILIHDNELDPLQWDYEILSGSWNFPEHNFPSVGSDFNYNVSDNFFEQLFEEGKVVDGTIMFDEDSQDYYIPGYIQKDDQTAKNSKVENDDELGQGEIS